jgi:hypothetical protein
VYNFLDILTIFSQEGKLRHLKSMAKKVLSP